MIILLILVVASPSTAGKPIHDFTLKDFDGTPVTLSSFKGKPILLDFWASWCGPCRKAMPFLASLHEKYAQGGFVLIGVNLDSKVDVPKFKQLLQTYNVKYSNVIAYGSDVMNRYGVSAMPTTVLINPNFEEELRFVGMSPSAESQLDSRINKMLSGTSQPLNVCLGFIKIAGDKSDAGLSDKIRGLVSQSLKSSKTNLQVTYSLPGDDPTGNCDFGISGSFTAESGKGRLTVNLIDSKTGMKLNSVSEFGKMEELEPMVQKVVTQLSPSLVKQ